MSATPTALVASILFSLSKLLSFTDADLEGFTDDLRQIDEDLVAITEELNPEG